MLRKGTHKICEKKNEGKPYSGDRIEELEKELAESEMNSAEVSGLRETYNKQFGFFVRRLTRHAASKSLRVNF